ncbi:polyphosphate polymerase domain-containing protein [Streptococcus massiliensis]|uniref:SPX domain-containing protein n=1 Tax=Streptococcus massiliensis TaxID=313439 RepID=A0A380KZ35_9STRE|nr:polyphosphate polymerase domain-containing protein [Streptococcus massiliensis]SUN76344.1 SPX domain-containing protein [Streptococcus massiliensis]
MAKKTFKDKFQRFETKYVISKETLVLLLAEFEGNMLEDEHAYSTIGNLYYDTPTYQMIRESLEKPYFKEKLRVRTYDADPIENSQVFLEIKKKVRKIVYKRRIATDLLRAESYLAGREVCLDDSQIKEEIDWLCERYGGVQPMMYIYYNRYSMKGKEDENVRITIDHDVTYRNYDLSLLDGRHGQALLPDNHVIMEIKVPGAYPLWLSEILDRHRVFPKSFSKYGVAYKKISHQMPVGAR